MPVSRSAVRAWSALAVAGLALLPLGVACSVGDPGGGVQPGPGQGQAGSAGVAGTTSGGSTGTAGATTQAGTPGSGGSGGSAGEVGTAGTAAGGVSSGGSGTGGAATGGASSGGTGGIEAGDTAPWRPLMVVAAKGEHVHGKAGLDTRATKMLGKLVVDIGVNEGGYSGFLAKRGYHSMGAPCGSCAAPNLGNDRDTVGNCRMQEFATTAASVKSQLTTLQAQYPEEDWGYFLNQDGSVRWSDVAITGISHGATTSAIAGRIGERMWRIVSRSGPRDNTCGLGDGKCSAPLSTPSYDAACPDADVASWLDQPSKTPMNRFYALVGMTDGQCGDIMFNMHRTQYLGEPTIFDNAAATFSEETHQFFAASAGHYDFLAAPNGVMRADEALEIAFGIPAENRHPNF